MPTHKVQIVIYDFGSQFTHLILRKLRGFGIYCTIASPNTRETLPSHTAGIILSGGPRSVTPKDLAFLNTMLRHHPEIPILGICYGMQLLAKHFGHAVHHLTQCEYGPQTIHVHKKHPLFHHIPPIQTVWMSHGDHVDVDAKSRDCICAKSSTGTTAAMTFGSHIVAVQFHPEVSHTTYGHAMLENFALRIVKAKKDWNPKAIYSEANNIISEQIIRPKHNVLCAVSGGVDSTVLACLLQKICPEQVHFVHVDHGLHRKEESNQVIAAFQKRNVRVQRIDAEAQFLKALRGIRDPEKKRKTIGKTFIDVFAVYAKLHHITHLVQGTLYPDIIESKPQVGKSSVIKSHHNVGGLPKNSPLKIIEPFSALYKDDVRRLGTMLGLPKSVLFRHPFPGPGLAIRIMGAVTSEKLAVLRACDAVLIDFLKTHKLYDGIWQAGCIWLPIKTVGVKGDKRAYHPTVAIRCVVSQNAMTAHAARLTIDQLEACATEILNHVPEIGRVVYDVSPKPPATIEWE